jgi:hypothetical protein
MAERTMLFCDSCGRPAVETVTFKTSSGNRQRDYCSPHLDELLSGSRTPKRGRRPGSTSAARSSTKKPAARKTSARKASGAKKRTRKKVVAKA